MRSGHIGERPLVRRDVGQEQPGLDRRVEGVGVKVRLRIGRGVVTMREDRLDSDIVEFSRVIECEKPEQS